VNAAMTDAQGPGSHVLYQDFVVPSIVNGAFVRFSLFVNNAAGTFETPEHLDYFTPDLNQQARVDVMTTSADPFSAAPADILQNLYQTESGDPSVSGYTPFIRDITSLLQARQGQTLRLRFAEVDNVQLLNLGVDNVDIVDAVPEPASWMLTVAGLFAAFTASHRRRI
jgi:hypothetical protein